MFTKNDLKVGDMVGTRDKDKYIVQDNNILANIMCGWMSLNSYDDNMLISKKEQDEYDEYGNDNFDIMKVYRVKNTAYECIWDRAKQEKKDKMLHKEYLIEQIDSGKECPNEDWSIKIYPNSVDGYGKAEGNIEIVLESLEEDATLFLSIDGAKELIEHLNEIIDYIEK